MLKAKDVMTTDTISVKEDTPILEAVQLMVKHDISGMPVVEDDMTLVGVLSEKDVIILFYNNAEDAKKTVGDFMTQPPIYFDAEDNLKDVCDFLVKNIFRRVPITSKNKQVGIISVRDVLECVLERNRRGSEGGDTAE
ncbi:MAG: CBS domain-containing protein [Planctomycetota bacterium]|nr:MAG: CBS domain-containing protein [Planctomycetota bacterium]